MSGTETVPARQRWRGLRKTVTSAIVELEYQLISLRDAIAKTPNGKDWVLDTPTKRDGYEGTECVAAVQDAIDRLEQALLRLREPHRNLVASFPEDE